MQTKFMRLFITAITDNVTCFKLHCTYYDRACTLLLLLLHYNTSFYYFTLL